MAPRISRAATEARTRILDDLKADHRRVKKAYKAFEKSEGDDEERSAIVQQVLQELTVHAAIEEELLYPASRGVVEDDLVDEAEVEHETMHTAMEQLRSMSPGDDKYYARFTVLCEYVLHHVKEEEGEMFPQLESKRLDWESLASQIDERRAALTDSEAEGDDAAAEEAAVATPKPAARRRSGNGSSRAVSR